MSVRLTHLSQVAHNQAIERGTLTPAERYEFSHLPMKRVDGTPVFDSARMRPDQIVEVTERLERITGRRVTGTVRDAVGIYLQDQGRYGVRVKDVCAEVGASKPIVLKYLRELIDAGHVRVTEEISRGNGSKRKRYHWAAFEPQLSNWAVEGEEHLPVHSDSLYGKNEWSGVLHHGAAINGLLCGCSACVYALEAAIEAEERSAALRRGETGLACGLGLRRVRRERQFAADRAIAVAAGLAAY